MRFKVATYLMVISVGIVAIPMYFYTQGADMDPGLTLGFLFFGALLGTIGHYLGVTAIEAEEEKKHE
jgi:hypothetical protein